MKKKNIENIRKDFNKSKIDFLNTVDCPIMYFKSWLDDILSIDPNEAISFVLSTVNEFNIPSSRVLLLREINDEGFIFYTNYMSRKGRDIEKNNNVSLNFNWASLERQIRIKGEVVKVSEEKSDDYFSSRPRNSQLGTWISNQSSNIELNTNLDELVENISKEFREKEVVRPNNWGGYLVLPKEIEFWQGRPSRMHDRLKYSKESNNWRKERLAP